jgi:MarR family 2-MHQ and catechol resistance regulon transcriptional repressor
MEIYVHSFMDKSKRDQLAVDAFQWITRAVEAMEQRVYSHLVNVQLTSSQYAVLNTLTRLGSLPVGRLGEEIVKSSGNMTLVIDNLVKRKLVQRRRRAADRRVVDIHLTPLGKELAAALQPGHIAGIVHSLGALSPDEQRQLSELGQKLVRGLRPQERNL